MYITLFIIFLTAGESGVKRIFPITRGFTEFHMIFVTGFDSRFCISALQKGAVVQRESERETEQEKESEKEKLEQSESERVKKVKLTDQTAQ